MIEIYFKEEGDQEFQTLDAVKAGCWIHVEEATIDDLWKICHTTGLEFADLQDCLDKYEVPRIERLEKEVILFTRYPTEEEVGLYTAPLTIILTELYFITIAPQPSLLVKNFLARKTKLSTDQKSKILIALLHRIVQEFTVQIKRVRHSVVKQEKELGSVESDDIFALTKNEEILNQFAAALDPLSHVLTALSSGRYASLYEQDHDLIEDLLNAVTQSEDICSINLSSIRSLRDSFQIVFTNNLHKTIKLLTSLTIIINIPTMIASIYGMNIPGLPFSKSVNAFFIILTIIMLFSIVALVLFRKKKWL